MFIIISFAMALGFPTYAFIMSAFVLMCYIQYAVGLPAIKRTEVPLYGNNPQGFFDQKMRLTATIWVAGIIVMIVIFAVLMYLEGALPAVDPEILPNVDISGSVIILMFSLAPFIPATFALIKASYEIDGIYMYLATMVLVVGMLLICLAIGLRKIPSDFVFHFYTFETFPFLPLSILALAASLIITYYLSKSAKKSFIRYINDENV